LKSQRCQSRSITTRCSVSPTLIMLTICGLICRYYAAESQPQV
jgi:hypothetical protein